MQVMPSIENNSIPPGGELSVAPTRHWVTCGLKPVVGGMFFPSLALSVLRYLS